MTDIHTPLIQKIQEVLEADSRVCAAWLEGSLARKEDDDLSDIDLWICVEDNAFQEFIDQREIFATKIGPVLSLLYPKTHNQPDDLDSFQVIFHDQPITCHLDVDVQKASRDFVFTKDSAAEEHRMLFDRKKVIQTVDGNAKELQAYLHTLTEFTLTQFWHRLPHVLVLLERENLLAAMASYRERLDDLVTLYRIVYTPEKTDWGFKDIEADLPKDVLHTLEDCTAELSLKSLKKSTRMLAKAVEKQMKLLRKHVHVEFPSSLVDAVNEVL